MDIKFKLTAEENAIEHALDAGAEKMIAATKKQKEQFAEIARNTLAKNKVITLRISERNLLRVKAAAAREGLSYQTYITALLHKHV